MLSVADNEPTETGEKLMLNVAVAEGFNWRGTAGKLPSAKLPVGSMMPIPATEAATVPVLVIVNCTEVVFPSPTVGNDTTPPGITLFVAPPTTYEYVNWGPRPVAEREKLSVPTCSRPVKGPV